MEEAAKRDPEERDVLFYYRFQNGRPMLNVRDTSGKFVTRKLKREDLVPDESVLSQRKGSDVHPEVTWVGQQFARIQTFREWSFWALFPTAPTLLLPDSRNLGLGFVVKNQIVSLTELPAFFSGFKRAREIEPLWHPSQFNCRIR